MDRTERERAFEAMARDVGPRALSVARGLLGSMPAAEDAVQEAFERAYRALGSYRGEAGLSTWFMRIVINTAHRQGRRGRRYLPTAEPPPDVGTPEPLTPQDRAEASQIQARLVGALQRLSGRQRTAFVLRYLEGLGTEETAALMECAPGTVKATLHAAVGKLRHELGDLHTEESR